MKEIPQPQSFIEAIKDMLLKMEPGQSETYDTTNRHFAKFHRGFYRAVRELKTELDDKWITKLQPEDNLFTIIRLR